MYILKHKSFYCITLFYVLSYWSMVVNDAVHHNDEIVDNSTLLLYLRLLFIKYIFDNPVVLI